jgi:hypothetical protein
VSSKPAFGAVVARALRQAHQTAWRCKSFDLRHDLFKPNRFKVGRLNESIRSANSSSLGQNSTQPGEPHSPIINVDAREARSLDELNGYLERCSNEDRRRILSRRTEKVGAAMLNEQPHLLPLAAEPFDLAEISFPTVDSVRVRTNRYSVPLPPGTKVEARVHAATVKLSHGGKRVARHERCYSRQQKILDLEHYLDVLRKKPGALAGSTPLAQWRQGDAGQRPSISCGRR